MKVYEDGKEFLEDYDLSEWTCETEGIQKLTMTQFLSHIKHEKIIVECGERNYVYFHILPFYEGEECYVRDLGNFPFWIVYINGKCTGEIFLSEKEANSHSGFVVPRRLDT